MEMDYELFPEESIKLIVLHEWNVVKRREGELIDCEKKKNRESVSFSFRKGLVSSLIPAVIYFDSYLIEFYFIPIKKSLLWATKE